MDVADIITELGNHGFEDETTAQMMYVINDTIWDIDSRERWPYLQKSVSLNFDGTNPYPSNLPTDFKAAIFIADTTTGEGVWPERVETIRDKYGASLTAVDVPFAYYFVGNQLRFYPTPAASTGRFLLDYQAIQPELTSSDVEASILIPARHHRAIVLGALYKLYMLEDDPELAPGFKSEYEQRIQMMREDVMRQQYQRPDTIFLNDYEDMDYENYWT